MKLNIHGKGTWRRGLALILALGLLPVASACGKDEEPEISMAPAVQTPVLQVTTQAPQAAEPQADSPEVQDAPASQAQLALTQSVAYYFPSTQSLYAAIEYENTGDSPAFLEEVKLVFNTGAKRVDCSFTPMLNEDDFIYPGQKATLAYWRKYDAEGELGTDSPIALEDIAFSAANWPADRADLRLTIQDCSVIQNYPNFATLTGNAINDGEKDYALSLIYASFYDGDGKLVGVWHFTKNMAIRAESKRNFSVHLDALPIPDLESRTAEVVGRGIGIE